MSRAVLDESQIHPAIRARVATWQQDTVREVQAAIAAHAVVVVGMGMNPHPKRARRALDEAGVACHYVGYGSYFSHWRPRSALVGGASELKGLIASGGLKTLLAAP